MRFLHTSDWHLGRTLHGEDLHGAHEAFLDAVVDVARSEGVDAVLVAGDIYDRPIPPLASVELLDDALYRLAEVCPVVITSGNHDSATRLGFGARNLRENLHVRTTVAGAGVPIDIPDRDGHLAGRVFALPYLDPDMTRLELGDIVDGERIPVARSHEAVVGSAMRRVLAGLEATPHRVPTAVMAHAFVTGGEPSDSERDIVVGGVAHVAASTLAAEGVDYVALGHLHGPQDLTSPIPVRYSGSPLPFSFSERAHTKSMRLVELGSAGLVSEQRIETPVARRLADLRGTIDEVLDGRFDAHRDDYVRVTVTDPLRPQHLFARLKDRFDHLLVVLHEPPEREGVTGLPGVARERIEPRVALGSFVEQVTGAAPTVAEEEILTSAWETARAQQEAER